MQQWKCIEGNCDTCHLRSVCEQEKPTGEFTRWMKKSG